MTPAMAAPLRANRRLLRRPALQARARPAIIDSTAASSISRESARASWTTLDAVRHLGRRRVPRARLSAVISNGRPAGLRGRRLLDSLERRMTVSAAWLVPGRRRRPPVADYRQEAVPA